MENLKTKSENYQNTDENREKFVKEFNENVLDLEKLNDRENAFKVERELDKIGYQYTGTGSVHDPVRGISHQRIKERPDYRKGYIGRRQR